MDAQVADRIRNEIQLSSETLPFGEDLVDWIVDALVQANVPLRTVSSDELKDLLTLARQRRCTPHADLTSSGMK